MPFRHGNFVWSIASPRTMTCSPPVRPHGRNRLAVFLITCWTSSRIRAALRGKPSASASRERARRTAWCSAHGIAFDVLEKQRRAFSRARRNDTIFASPTGRDPPRLALLLQACHASPLVQKAHILPAPKGPIGDPARHGTIRAPKPHRGINPAILRLPQWAIGRAHANHANVSARRRYRPAAAQYAARTRWQEIVDLFN